MRPIFLALPFVALASIAAVGPMTTSTANTIAGIVMLVAPFVLKYVKLDGAKMALLSYGVALVTALGAGFLSGDLSGSDFNVATVVTTSAALWAVMQGVFQLFKDNGTFGSRLR